MKIGNVAPTTRDRRSRWPVDSLGALSALKREKREETSFSGQPALAAAVALDLAIRLAAADLVQAEVELLDVRVLRQHVRLAFEHDAPGLEHVAVIGKRERHRRVLLYEQHRDAL